jgi:hypothetical protein
MGEQTWGGTGKETVSQKTLSHVSAFGGAFAEASNSWLDAGSVL